MPSRQSGSTFTNILTFFIVFIICVQWQISSENDDLKKRFINVKADTYKVQREVERCLISDECTNKKEGVMGINENSMKQLNSGLNVMSSYTEGFDVNMEGTITVRTNPLMFEGKRYNYVVTPLIQGKSVQWTESGTCKTRKNGAIC